MPQKGVNSYKGLTCYGFTLIEIMVVLIIISITATFAVLSLGHFNQSHQVKLVAEDIANKIPLAEQQAILQPAVLGLMIKSDGYGFYRFVVDAKTHIGSWQALTHDRILNQTSSSVVIRIKTDDNFAATPYQQRDNTPQLIFLPSGDINIFKIYVGEKNRAFSYRLEQKNDGSLQLTQLKNTHEK